MHLLEILLGVGLVAWCGLGIFHFWNAMGATLLRAENISEPLPRAPKVSIIVPARNEEVTLPAALESLFKLDYPNYEVIFVDDDSDDRTGQIADDWAGRPESAGRLKVIHNRELPAGWVGKVHALSLAVGAARGEWILATDADVVFHPAILRLAMGCALRQGVHFLSFAPELVVASFWEKAVLPAFSFLLLSLFPIRLVNEPRSPRAIAAGAFILMRHDDLKALGGYERLRNTIIEDLRIAEMFKRNGRRIYVAFTRGLFRTRMYRSRHELWEGLSRSAYEGAGFSIAKVWAGIITGSLLAILPWVSVFALSLREAGLGHSPMGDPALLLALGVCGMSSLVYLAFLIAFGVSPLYVFTFPLATGFYSAAALNSVWKSVVGSGVPWKGRGYRPPKRQR